MIEQMKDNYYVVFEKGSEFTNEVDFREFIDCINSGGRQKQVQVAPGQFMNVCIKDDVTTNVTNNSIKEVENRLAEVIKMLQQINNEEKDVTIMEELVY